VQDVRGPPRLERVLEDEQRPDQHPLSPSSTSPIVVTLSLYTLSARCMRYSSRSSARSSSSTVIDFDCSGQNVTRDCPVREQVGCGAVSADFLEAVASYPNPDDKIRTTDLKVLDEFNCRITPRLRCHFLACFHVLLATSAGRLCAILLSIDSGSLRYSSDSSVLHSLFFRNELGVFLMA